MDIENKHNNEPFNTVAAVLTRPKGGYIERKSNKVKIGDYEYEKDNTNSYHRVFYNGEQSQIQSYYRHHIYIDGNFENEISIAKITETELQMKFQNDIQRTNKTFEVLKQWDLIPTSNSNILDLGCGYGMFINQWMNKGYGNGYGVEISPLVKQISPVSDNIDIINVNSIETIHKLHDITLIVAFDIIEHLFDVKHVLNVIYSKIKRGVQMIIEIPVIPANTDERQLANYKYLYPTRHLHLFTRQGIEQEFVRAGFQIKKRELKNNNNNKYLILIEK